MLSYEYDYYIPTEQDRRNMFNFTIQDSDTDIMYHSDDETIPDMDSDCDSTIEVVDISNLVDEPIYAYSINYQFFKKRINRIKYSIIQKIITLFHKN